MSLEASEKALHAVGWRAKRLAAALGVILALGTLFLVLRLGGRQSDVSSCSVVLPLLSHSNVSRLFAFAEGLLEGSEEEEPEINGLLHESAVWSKLQTSDIPALEADTLKARMPTEPQMQCTADTYGTFPLKLLAKAWTEAHTLAKGDLLVDLGAGNGYVLVAAALLTNASGRGVELSLSRFRTACEILEMLQALLAGRNGHHNLAAPASAGVRRFEVFLGDLFEPPYGLRWALPPNPEGQTIIFSYSNCFGDEFIERIMRMVMQVPHERVKLMISKLLRDETRISALGLKRVKNSGIHTYVKDKT